MEIRREELIVGWGVVFVVGRVRCVQMFMIRTSIKQREGERESPEIRLGKFLASPGQIPVGEI